MCQFVQWFVELEVVAATEQVRSEQIALFVQLAELADGATARHTYRRIYTPAD
jgi:hypothetical protein